MNQVEAYLSGQRCGLYMLTVQPPLLMPVGDTDEKDLYLAPGEPIGYRFICPLGVKLIWGVKLKRLETIRVTVRGETLR